MDFICNICDAVIFDCPAEAIDREVPSCPTCGSTVRWRSVVNELSLALFDKSLSLSEFPTNKKISGMGLSDWAGYADRLTKKFPYQNVFYHQEPFFDVSAPLADERRGKYDFLISSDVFEHVAPPVSRAFQNAFDLLKPGGHFILTVPYVPNEETAEHYPHLYNYSVVNLHDEFVVLNKLKDGTFEVHKNPVFHGGPGTVLEMRVFGKRDIEQQLTEAGFVDVVFDGASAENWGIIHNVEYGLPIRARKAKKSILSKLRESF